MSVRLSRLTGAPGTVLLILLALVTPRVGLSQEPEYMPGELLVCYEAATTEHEIQALEAQFGQFDVSRSDPFRAVAVRILDAHPHHARRAARRKAAQTADRQIERSQLLHGFRNDLAHPRQARVIDVPEKLERDVQLIVGAPTHVWPGRQLLEYEARDC